MLKSDSEWDVLVKWINHEDEYRMPEETGNTIFRRVMTTTTKFLASRKGRL